MTIWTETSTMVNLIELGLIEVKLATWLSLSVADDLDEDWILL